LRHEPNAGTRDDRLTTEERERLRALEREGRELRKANDILNGLRMCFAKELDGTPRN
jgi:transposase-like protein